MRRAVDDNTPLRRDLSRKFSWTRDSRRMHNVGMPHTIRIDDETHELSDAWSVGQPALRIFRTANGDALVCVGAAVRATRDGLAMPGRATVVAWGVSALLRLDGRKIDITWRPGGIRRPARPGEMCRLCFGEAGAGEPVRTCACLAVFHIDCERARRDCGTCGRPPERGNHE